MAVRSALRAGRAILPRNILWHSFLSKPQGHSAAGRASYTETQRSTVVYLFLIFSVNSDILFPDWHDLVDPCRKGV
jgi:hypothetical protein